VRLRRRRRDERGSVLALVPAAILVLMLLGAMAVDSAVAYLGQRQLADALAAAANDAATAGLSNTAFYRSGAVRLDPSAVDRVVCTTVRGQDDGQLHGLRVEVGVTATVVELRGRATVDAVFGRMLPGFATRTVSAGAVAQVEPGPRAPAPLPTGLVPLRCG